MERFVYDLIAKVLSGEATANEAAQLQEARAADPAVEAAFKDVQVLWDLMDTALPRFPVDKAAAWQKIAARTGIEETQSAFGNAGISGNPALKPKRIAVPIWTRWAAAAAVVAVGATLLLKQLPEKTQTILATENRQQVSLPDGSTVTLRKNARLQYAASFEAKSERHVSLEGEAFFEVAKDAQHPFTIDAQGLEVTVLGTSFLVNSGAKEIAVRTGKVQVAGHENQATVVLTAGEGIQLTDGNFRKEAADSNDYYLKTGRIVFQAKPFEEIIRDISRILEVPVQVDASIPAAGRAQAVTYSTTAASAEAVLTDLCRITGYQWRMEGGSYRIFQAR